MLPQVNPIAEIVRREPFRPAALQACSYLHYETGLCVEQTLLLDIGDCLLSRATPHSHRRAPRPPFPLTTPTMAYTAAFASPLAPKHLAPPSTMSAYCITSLFRLRTPKASSSLGKPTKSKKRSSKPPKTLEISLPVISTPCTTGHNYCLSSSSFLSPPPPPYRRAELESLEGSLRRDEGRQDKGVMNCSLKVGCLIYYSG